MLYLVSSKFYFIQRWRYIAIKKLRLFKATTKIPDFYNVSHNESIRHLSILGFFSLHRVSIACVSHARVRVAESPIKLSNSSRGILTFAKSCARLRLSSTGIFFFFFFHSQYRISSVARKISSKSLSCLIEH